MKISAMQRDQRDRQDEIKHYNRTIRVSKDTKAADLRVYEDELEVAEREMEMR